MHTNDTKKKAQILRRNGFSYSYISKSINVSKSTLSIWLKDIKFQANKYTQKSLINGSRKLNDLKRSDKFQSIVLAENFAKNTVMNVSEQQIFYLGIGIYIGEGSKTANIVRIVNSDSKIIKFMCLWFKKFFQVTTNNIKIRIHMYPDNDETSVIKYWTKELKLPHKCFQPVSVDYRKNKSVDRAGILSNGTAHLSIVSRGNKNLGVLLHRKILATIDHVLDWRD